ncbi:hypothetical protein Y032_0027g1507 [Ancylostoma ceylanicum]|uniref:Uncharacterized protein n=1 Tax=Ancylostoma ceylanicum TaxID=53326 RepID=A0A016UT97_9BILA|nr:hypothetical protein Y032_0027g1507 [Ancylostoma ceylanicum]
MGIRPSSLSLAMVTPVLSLFSAAEYQCRLFFAFLYFLVVCIVLFVCLFVPTQHARDSSLFSPCSGCQMLNEALTRVSALFKRLFGAHTIVP